MTTRRDLMRAFEDSPISITRSSDGFELRSVGPDGKEYGLTYVDDSVDSFMDLPHGVNLELAAAMWFRYKDAYGDNA